MFSLIYVEKTVVDNPETERILRRFPRIPVVEIESYGEVFNRKGQNFRLQKMRPALILAKKYGQFVHATPENYGIGSEHNYYYSHMLNCVFDCRYCFLQGMFRSAHYVHFVNHDDFAQAIQEKAEEHKDSTLSFFSGYDCDSLALESITGFVEKSLPLFESLPHATLELRTKSANIAFLLKRKPIKNVVVSFTLTPEKVVRSLEHKTASFEARLSALERLGEAGWPIGLRFDPLFPFHDYESIYEEFFLRVFSRLKSFPIHSVSLGTFRMPKSIFQRIQKLYPDEKIFAHSYEEEKGLVTLRKDLLSPFLQFCEERILNEIPEEKFFPCQEHNVMVAS